MYKILRWSVCILLLVGSLSPLANAQILASHEEKKEDDQAAYTQQPDKQKVNLQDVLKRLEKKHRVSIAYRAGLVENKWINKIELKEKTSPEEDLETVLKNSGLQYKEADKDFYIVFQKEKESALLLQGIQPLASFEDIQVAASSVNILATIERSISGTVTDEDEQPLPGVNVLVKGTSTGTITDIKGQYKLTVADEASALVFTFVGYQSEEVSIGNANTVDVVMFSDIKSLSEVVVTALGFEEDADQLGSTSSKIEGESIQKSGESGLISSLAGRASGLQISSQSGDPGAGAFIQIRGQSTITGNTQPLIVVDGVPISNSTVGSGEGGVVQQSRLNDINPNDIASVQVLKGASAAALWGSRAANGVIILTTKKGKSSDKINVSFSSSFSLDQINAFHPRQNSFGQGMDGNYNPTHANSWGDRIADRAGGADDVDQSGEFFEALDGTRYYPILTRNSRETYVDSNYDDVFDTGYFWDKSLSLSGGDDQATYFFSVGDLDQQGILNGNSDYRRTTLRLNTTKKFNRYIRISNNASYTRSMADRVQRGNNTAGAMLGLLRTPPDFDNHHYIGSYYSGPEASPVQERQRSYRRYLGSSPYPIYNNPLWALNEQTNTSRVNRFINSFELNVKPMVDWFDITARVGVDHYADNRLSYAPINDSRGNGSGAFDETLITEDEINMDLIGRVVHNISKDFSATYILGFNINDRQFFSTGGSLINYLIPDGPVSFNNATAENRTPENQKRHIRVARMYSTINFSTYDMLFLNASLAGEAASSFGDLSDKTFYYPSADLAWQFSDVGALQDMSFLSFGKLRASYGVVGVQPLPYRSNTTFEAASFSNSPWGDNLDGAQYGNGAFLMNTELGDPELKPERKTEYEIGADLRFFNDRLSTSFTYYQNEISDLLIPVTLASSVGFASMYTNAATMENKGIELDVSYNLISNRNFYWDIHANFNRNRNEVIDLAGTESLYLTGRVDRADMRAVEGQQAGVFWGGRFERNEEGSLVLDENNFPIAAATLGVIGDPNPDWRGGFGTTFSFKGFTLDALFETFQGGDFASLTRGVMYTFGTHGDLGNEVTLEQDLLNYAGELIPAGSTVRGNIHDFGGGPVLLDQAYYTTLGSGLGSVPEQFIEDGSWTRLRQLSLSYTLNSEAFREATKLQSVEVGVTGRNLLLWTKVDGIDPDTNFTGNYYGRGYDYFNSPSTRSFLFSVKINY